MEDKQYEITENIFDSSKYVQYVIEYNGDINNVKKIENIYITKIDAQYAILSIKAELLLAYQDVSEVRKLLETHGVVNNDFNIIYISSPQAYTLQQISAIDEAKVSSIQGGQPLNLTGKGVIVGIIDTGIDYLNKEFMDEEGKTRIVEIWDQTINSNINENKSVPFGTVYNKEQINRAINLYRNGGDPYSIVPSKDENGHGTNMAGIVGASGKNENIKGVAPECEFVIVKLSEANLLKKRLNINIPVYALPSIFIAVEYLKRILLNKNKPVVILLPLGSNNGNHKGDNIFNSFIESVSSNVGIVLVTGSGNEALQDGHVSGIIMNKDRIESIGLVIAENQKTMIAEFWIDLPNIMDISVVAPSGEETGFVTSTLNVNKKFSFTVEKTDIQIQYFLPEEYTGDQLISIYFSNISEGLWLLKLRLKYGEVATYNAWILQNGIALPGTRFSSSDPYGTVTIPGDSDFVVTVAAYDQNTDSLVPYSGVSFREEYIDKIDFAAGGANTKTVGLNNSIKIINGTSLSAAIGAGACILLFEWGIVKGNYPYMYVQSIKTFLRRGVDKRRNDIYPNPNWGYGMLNIYKIFEMMM